MRRRPGSARETCEEVLTNDRRHNIDQRIWPRSIPIYDRLLARGSELEGAYKEIYNKLHPHPRSLQVFFMLLLDTALEWNPAKNAQARAGRDELIEVNRKIAETASSLAELLRRRSDLHDRSGFHAETHYNICDVMEAAGESNYLFRTGVKEKFFRLSAEYGLKYWPTLGDVMDELASDAADADVQASDPLTAAATEAARPSKADYFKALFAAFEENSGRDSAALPEGFKLTDGTLASLANCVLDSNADDLVDAAYVKRLRQRMRHCCWSLGLHAVMQDRNRPAVPTTYFQPAPARLRRERRAVRAAGAR